MSHPIFLHSLTLSIPKPVFTALDKRMASVSSILSPNLLQQHLTKPFTIPQQPNSKLSLHSLKSPNSPPISLRFSISHLGSNSKESKWVSAVAEETLVSTQDPLSEAARRVYIGNIPGTVNNDELRRIVEEHGAVEKAEVLAMKHGYSENVVVLVSDAGTRTDIVACIPGTRNMYRILFIHSLAVGYFEYGMDTSRAHQAMEHWWRYV